MSRKIEVISTKVYYVQMEPQDNLPQIIINMTNSPAGALKYLRDLESVYPNFFYWYDNIVLPDLLNKRNGRVMLFAISNVLNSSNKHDAVDKRLTGIAILKLNCEERKICTFRVFQEYRSQGIGKRLMSECFRYLGTTKPLISIAKESFKSFEPFIEKYDWCLCQTLQDFYRKGSAEYVYNGYLMSK